jgi:hypothetical protein
LKYASTRKTAIEVTGISGRAGLLVGSFTRLRLPNSEGTTRAGALIAGIGLRLSSDCLNPQITLIPQK